MFNCCEHTSGFDPIVPEGGYFVLTDISSIGKKFEGGEESYDFQFTKWMMREKVSLIFLPENENESLVHDMMYFVHNHVLELL